MIEPEHSLLLDGRLIAYVYSPSSERPPGLHRGGSAEHLAALDDAHIEAFSRPHETLLIEIAERCPALEAFLFEAQLEGVEPREGRATPGPNLRRF